MSPRALAERNAQAQIRIIDAVKRLGGEENIFANTNHRDPAVRALWEREAVADFLEALAEKPAAKKQAKKNEGEE